MHNVRMVDLKPLPPGQSLVAGIRDALSDAIVGGSLPAGYRLREIPLSEHFGCSTTPVREALRRLEHEGLVIVHPRRGAEVVSIGTETLANLYETRLVLECHGARAAAETTLPPSALAGLDQLLDQAQGLIDTAGFHEINMLDIEFHRRLSGLAGNDVLAELVERVARQIQVVRARTDAKVADGPKAALAQHRSIVGALRSGDADEVEEMIRQHITWSHQAVTASVNDALRRAETKPS